VGWLELLTGSVPERTRFQPLAGCGLPHYFQSRQ
jgi:hypothetical protein